MSTLSPPPPPPPPQSLEFPVINVWNEDETQQHYQFRYVVHQPWKWIMERVETSAMHALSETSLLPLALQQAASATQTTVTSTPRQRRVRNTARGRPKHQVPAVLRMEVVDPATEQVVVAWHCTSTAFDGLEDKDALVRTIQRCRVEERQLSPPSVLLNWDVSLEECRNVIGPSLPTIASNQEEQPFAVLKEPMGSQGKGIYFVKSVNEIHGIIDEHHQRAREEPEVLEGLIAAKGRIPSWVLQAEVTPCLLIRQGRKFHIRTYVVLVERPENDEILDLFIYHNHEVRIAGVPVTEETPVASSTDETSRRNPLAHITNGALSSSSERSILSQEAELKHLQPSLEVFVAEIFAKHLLQDISRRVTSHAAPSTAIREFAVAGLDLMVTTEERWFLLEVNVNPGAPSQALASTDEAFCRHLETFWKSLIDLVAGRPTEGFLDAFDILERAGITES